MRCIEFIVIAMISTAFGSAFAEDLPRSITVNGSAELEVEPDTATIEMGIFVFDHDLLKAKQDADARVANIFTTLKSLDIAVNDIRTTQIHIKPKYREREDNWDLLGYEITRSITVTARKLQQFNDILNKSIEAGANRIEQTTLSSSQEKELEQKLIDLAIDNAKRHARRLADGFQVKIGRVYAIDGGSGSTDIRYNRMLDAPVFGEGTFHPGRIKIESSVDVIFELAE